MEPFQSKMLDHVFPLWLDYKFLSRWLTWKKWVYTWPLFLNGDLPAVFSGFPGGLRSRAISHTHKILPVFSRPLKCYTDFEGIVSTFSSLTDAAPWIYEQCSRSVGDFYDWALDECDQVWDLLGNWFHTNKNAEYILRTIARQSKLTWGS